MLGATSVTNAFLRLITFHREKSIARKVAPMIDKKKPTYGVTSPHQCVTTDKSVMTNLVKLSNEKFRKRYTHTWEFILTNSA